MTTSTTPAAFWKLCSMATSRSIPPYRVRSPPRRNQGLAAGVSLELAGHGLLVALDSRSVLSTRPGNALAADHARPQPNYARRQRSNERAIFRRPQLQFQRSGTQFLYLVQDRG